MIVPSGGREQAGDTGEMRREIEGGRGKRDIFKGIRHGIIFI